MNIFEKATKQKLRVQTSIGLLTVEDLWHLPLSGVPISLNEVGKSLKRIIKDNSEEDLVDDGSLKRQNTEELSLEIIKYIISVKQDEEDERKVLLAKADRKRKLVAALARRRDNDLEEKSEEELIKMIDAL